MFTGDKRHAGPERGDIRVAKEVLPEKIGGWRVAGFSEPNEGGLAGVIGWTHSWNYESERMAALVAFDQIGFMRWHDLSLCYKANGCRISRMTTRSAESLSGEQWPYVEFYLSKDDGIFAYVVFSIFNGWGEPLNPGYGYNASISEGNRSLQCQVLVQYQGQLSEPERISAIRLHLFSREVFRREWLTQTQSSAIR